MCRGAPGFRCILFLFLGVCAMRFFVFRCFFVCRCSIFFVCRYLDVACNISTGICHYFHLLFSFCFSVCRYSDVACNVSTCICHYFVFCIRRLRLSVRPARLYILAGRLYRLAARLQILSLVFRFCGAGGGALCLWWGVQLLFTAGCP